MTIIYIFIFVLALYTIFFIWQFYNIIFKNYAPLISTKNKVLKRIIDHLDVNDADVVYELGCGKAVFLKLIEKQSLKARLIGIENMFIASIILKLQLFFLRSKIKVVQGDFFKVDLSDANIVYCFLNNKTMQRLGSKFLRECNPGTRIVSHKFPIAKLKPVKILGDIGSMIYYYEL